MSNTFTPDAEEEVAARLVERIHRGDSEAETQLVQRYQRGLTFMLRKIAGDPALAEDLCQDAFRIVLVRLRDSGLQDPSKLAGFLRNTARNLFLGDYRKKVRRKTDSLTFLSDPTSHVVDLEGELARREESKLVRQVLQALPVKRDRELLFRFYIAEEDKQTICRDLELDTLHFNRVIFRARSRFKALYEKSLARLESRSSGRSGTGRP